MHGGKIVRLWCEESCWGVFKANGEILMLTYMLLSDTSRQLVALECNIDKTECEVRPNGVVEMTILRWHMSDHKTDMVVEIRFEYSPKPARPSWVF